VTAHRRENWGEGLARVARAVRRLAVRFPDVRFVCPLHSNPDVRAPFTAELAGLPGVQLTPPLDYPAFCRALARAHVVLSDSGGIQEEAPSLGVPLVLLRESTERPEAVAAGAVLPVGTDEDLIVARVTGLLRDDAAHRAAARVANPFGDGHATDRVVGALAYLAGTGERPDEFEPAPAGPGEGDQS
jgi:UDP-N-acetylglucosamine 2-epimerase (non-hydrolysing)